MEFVGMDVTKDQEQKSKAALFDEPSPKECGTGEVLSVLKVVYPSTFLVRMSFLPGRRQGPVKSDSGVGKRME
jgi:hypothetical protein